MDIVVKYQLREYLQVLSDFAPLEHRRRAELKGKVVSSGLKKMSLPVKAMLFFVGTLAFVYKVNRVGTCRFRIDETGIERISKGGTLRAPWPAVIRVFKLSEVYLVQKAEGAMPIPFRCMSVVERAEFERLAGAKLAKPERSET